MTRGAGPSVPRRQLDVLVVDDSAVVRRFLSELLGQDHGIRIETASDPLIAMRKMKQRRPDVILLDIEMPRMDGLTFLRRIVAEDPIPVVICSGLAGRGTRIALEALRHGAVDIVAKPRYGVRDFLQESALMLVDTVRAAAEAKVMRLGRRPEEFTGRGGAARSGRDVQLTALARTPLIAIGASTGGPEAVRTVLAAMPRVAPGVLVVQHMSRSFTAGFADNLDRACAITVKEAEDGDRVQRGQALIAPGDRHMMVVRHGREFSVRLTDGPLVSRHRPSIDVLFRSVAQAAGGEAPGVILTGMGDDGVRGLLQMRQAGALTIAQDEASSVVFGMPKQAIARGAAARVAPLERIASLLLAPPPPGGSGWVPAPPFPEADGRESQAPGRVVAEAWDES